MLPTLLLDQLIFINLFKQFGQIKGFLWVSVSAAAGLGINLKVMSSSQISYYQGTSGGTTPRLFNT